jgi:hypothetical protein
VKSGHWKDIAELVGITAIVASLVFVGLQMMQARDIAISDGNLANAANKVERNNAILEHPDVWARGSAGEELNEADAVIFRYLVQNTIDITFFEVVRMRRLGADNIAEGLVADFAAFLLEHPGMRKMWVEEELRTQRYREQLSVADNSSHTSFAAEVRSYLARLDQLAD